MTTFMEGVSASEARRICGFETVAMLDYLQRSGVFVPSDRRAPRKGRRRRYSFRDLLVLKAIATLLSNGASVAAIKKALQEFQRSKWKADEGSLQTEDGKVLKYLFVSANSIYFAKSSDNIYDMTNEGQLVFSFVVDLASLHGEVCFKLKQNELPLALSSSA